MRRIAASLVVSLAAAWAAPARALECGDFWEWIHKGCRRIVDTYEKGDNEVLVSGYAWHLPWTWTSERRAEENELAWGGGLARTVDRENGDSDTVFFLVFKDSHGRAEYNLGYGWTTYWGEREKLQAGLGFTAMIIQRSDIFGGAPFPVLLPLMTVRHRNVEVLTTFIPTLNGGINHGSILYVFGKIGFK